MTDFNAVDNFMWVWLATNKVHNCSDTVCNICVIYST